VAAACIGTFVLAQTGLLDDQDATTTWWLAPLFRQRYPKIRLDESRMVVKSAKFVTAGAALSHMDLALSLIRQKSPKLAALTGKYLIVDTRPSQSAYILSDHLTHSDPIVQQFERWARNRLAEGFSLDEAAQAAGASKRTLARRMEAVMGKSPLSYFQDLRVERAVHLLKTSDQSIEEIATQVGYSEGVTLRTLSAVISVMASAKSDGASIRRVCNVWEKVDAARELIRKRQPVRAQDLHNAIR
jgi:transcriptional regulator GlxA family with amidase domain